MRALAACACADPAAAAALASAAGIGALLGVLRGHPGTEPGLAMTVPDEAAGNAALCLAAVALAPGALEVLHAADAATPLVGALRTARGTTR